MIKILLVIILVFEVSGQRNVPRPPDQSLQCQCAGPPNCPNRNEYVQLLQAEPPLCRERLMERCSMIDILELAERASCMFNARKFFRECPRFPPQLQGRINNCIECVQRCRGRQETPFTCQAHCSSIQTCPNPDQIFTTLNRQPLECRNCISNICGPINIKNRLQVSDCMFRSRVRCLSCPMGAAVQQVRQNCDRCLNECQGQPGFNVFPEFSGVMFTNETLPSPASNFSGIQQQNNFQQFGSQFPADNRPQQLNGQIMNPYGLINQERFPPGGEIPLQNQVIPQNVAFQSPQNQSASFEVSGILTQNQQGNFPRQQMLESQILQQNSFPNQKDQFGGVFGRNFGQGHFGGFIRPSIPFTGRPFSNHCPCRLCPGQGYMISSITRNRPMCHICIMWHCGNLLHFRNYYGFINCALHSRTFCHGCPPPGSLFSSCRSCLNRCPGLGGPAPGFGVQLPGQGGQLPGQGRQFPSQSGRFPGQGGQFPGQGGQFPGQGGLVPGIGKQGPGVNGQRPPSGPGLLGSTTEISCRQSCTGNQLCPSSNAILFAFQRFLPACRSCAESLCGPIDPTNIFSSADCRYQARDSCNSCFVTERERIQRQMCDNCLRQCATLSQNGSELSPSGRGQTFTTSAETITRVPETSAMLAEVVNPTNASFVVG